MIHPSVPKPVKNLVECHLRFVKLAKQAQACGSKMTLATYKTCIKVNGEAIRSKLAYQRLKARAA